MASSAKYHIALIAANMIYGINYSYYSSIIENIMSADNLFFLRIVANVLIFVPYIFIFGTWRIEKKDLPVIFLSVALVTFGRQLLMIKAMQYTSPVDSSIIATISPIFVMAMAAIILKERIKRWRLIGMIMGLAGAIVLIVSTSTNTSTGKGHLIGNMLILASIISISLNTVVVKKVISKYNPFTIIGWSAAISLIISTPFFIKDAIKIDTSHWNLPQWGEMVYILTIGTVVVIALFYYGLKHASPTAVSIYTYSQPLVATIFAVARGQDHITTIVVVSAAMILCGVILVERTFSSENKSSPIA